MAVFTADKSNFRFARLYRTQDTAAFQESHADYYEHCHGVFHTMVYDNMRVAVRKFVGLYEKEPTTALTELSIYYGFQFRFCNIRSGNEKGHVERSVEYIRRKVFCGPGNDIFDSLAKANEFLYRECMKLNARDIYNDTVPTEVFEWEKKLLLPEMPKFESCIKNPGTVDKYSTIVVAQNHYSIPDTLVGKRVEVRMYTDKIVVYHEGEIVARHERSFKGHDWKIDIYHYLRTLRRKPGALHQSTALLQSDTLIKNLYEKDLLFSNLSLRASRKSTIITSNLTFERWDEVFGDAAITSALVDRLTYKAILVDTEGTPTAYGKPLGRIALYLITLRRRRKMRFKKHVT